jgi:hypothetical protein
LDSFQASCNIEVMQMQDLQGSQGSTPAWEAAATSMTRAGMRRKVLLASHSELLLMFGAFM